MRYTGSLTYHFELFTEEYEYISIIKFTGLGTFSRLDRRNSRERALWCDAFCFLLDKLDFNILRKLPISVPCQRGVPSTSFRRLFHKLA